MDEQDKAIINRMQSDFPRDARPYAVLARELGLEESQVLSRVARLREQGIIRRIGGNFVPDRLGFVSTLCAARVPEEGLEAFAAAVNAYSGVTHNYQRDNAYNVWFTFIAPSMEIIEKNLRDIRQRTGVADIINLPATRVFKIRAQFEV